MPLLLDIPYSEKDEAKLLGALWNPDFKKWYVPNKRDYPHFSKWISPDSPVTVICDFFYIVEGIRTCYKCGKPTTVIGFGVENFYEIAHDYECCQYYSDYINICSEISPLPADLLKYLKDKYNYYKSFSKTAQEEYFANHCDNCGAIQGDYFLFEEEDSPFFVESVASAAKLKLYKIPLKFDLIKDIDFAFSPEDNLLKKHSTIIDLDYDFMTESFCPKIVPETKTSSKTEYTSINIPIENRSYNLKNESSKTLIYQTHSENKKLTNQLIDNFIKQQRSRAFKIFYTLFNTIGVIVLVVTLYIIVSFSSNKSLPPSSQHTPISAASTDIDGNRPSKTILLSMTVGEHPGAKGTYIMVRDGNKTVCSKIFTKGTKLEFYSNKYLVITDNKSTEKEIKILSDIIQLEVANSFTKVYQSNKKIKPSKNFKFDFIKNEVI